MKTYDIAAYLWPSYTGKENRSRIFWPNGIGEWQTVQKTHVKQDGAYRVPVIPTVSFYLWFTNATGMDVMSADAAFRERYFGRR